MESLLAGPKPVTIDIVIYKQASVCGFETDYRTVEASWLEVNFGVIDWPDGTLAAVFCWPNTDIRLVVHRSKLF